MTNASPRSTPTTPTTSSTPRTPMKPPALRRLRLDRLRPHPDHEPAVAKATRLRLADALTRFGGPVLPLLVRPHPDQAGAYEVLDGHQRLEHLRHRGERRAACLIITADDATARLLRAMLGTFRSTNAPEAAARLTRRIHADGNLDDLARLTGQPRVRLRRLARDGDRPQRPRRPRDPASAVRPLHLFLNEAERERVVRALGNDRRRALMRLLDGAADAPGAPQRT